MVFSKADVAIGGDGVAVFYCNEDGKWVSQEFEDDTLAGFSKILSGVSSVRFRLMPKNGVQLSFVSDKIISGNLPTFFYPRLEKPLSDEEFERRVFEYGPPRNPNEKAMEIIKNIDPENEVSVKEGLIKWIIALTISDDNITSLSKARNWASLRKSAEFFADMHPEFGELELSEPIDGGDFGFAEFHISTEYDAVLQLGGKGLADFRSLLWKSKGVILETGRENGTVYVNLVFSV